MHCPLFQEGIKYFIVELRLKINSRGVQDDIGVKLEHAIQKKKTQQVGKIME
jgi:hypothetical protein